MASEYDVPSFSRPHSPEALERFARVKAEFQAAAGPYLTSPWGWLAWGLLLPGVALVTGTLGRELGFRSLLLLWSVAILLAGAVEAFGVRRAGTTGSPLASWALTVQGNLSIVGLALTILLLVRDQAWALPGLWLLLLGHSFFSLGGLSFPLLRRYGLAYQAGGVAALCLPAFSLLAFAVTTALANLSLAVAVWRRSR